MPYSQGSLGPGCLIFFSDYYLPYSNNALRCALSGAVLAEPRTLDAANFLAYGRNTGEPVWTGLSRDANGDLRWQDGSLPVYTNWAPGQPDNTPDKKCVVMDTTMLWRTDFCNATYQAACFRPQLQCPYGYQYYEGGLGCIRASTAAKTFDAADQECRAEGAVLARLPRLDAVSYFANFRTGQSDFWVNVKNVSSGVAWSLRDTIGQRIPYSGTGVCHHGTNKHSVHEVLSNVPNDKCTRIAVANGKAWTPSLCNSTYQFFCERSKVQCPFGYAAVASENGVTECYLYTGLRNNISLATAYCNSLGNILAEAKTASASSFISYFRGDSIAIWFGLRYNSAVKNWVWSNGMVATNQPWKGGYANGYYVSGQDCATIQAGWWTGRTCKSIYYFYCSTPLECPEGFVSYLSGRGCYWKSDQKMNYTSALSTCTSKGSILAEARDDVANQFFGSLWPGSEPYIGLTKRSNGSWVWQDGSNTSIYSNYSAGRPYTGNLGLNCTIITNSLGWQDSNCSDARYFACTKDQTPKKICADFTSDCKSWVNDIPNFCSLPEKSYMAYYVCPLTCGICRRPCPEGYTQVGYNGDCYRYYGDPMTYSDAQQQCAADGAVLYPAKTASDLLFLLSFQNSSGVWVGLTDSATEGTWKYSDDTLMTDSSLWMSGEPDNVYQGITPCNCATASLPANLMDYPCGQKQPFVCKRAYDPM
ncbi:macrophage mannose receptor 1-like isoform X2 [Pomacea canaliculata]|uniref:macrophage mannose receptor 1-like isoform X2 n=1 Tax=Pomacea canaliculata TaxID=400727 RepID=UPI000D72BD11|nr:macrophage mannose receptor 1-like isoform X2 [Pomacea canaliculata]